MRVEYLGADRLVYGVLEPPLPQEKVIAKLPSMVTVTVEQGKEYRFGVKKRDLRRFARESGLSSNSGTV